MVCFLILGILFKEKTGDMETGDLKAVFDTLMSAPGMEDQVKIDLRISRKVALFMVTVIEKGLEAKKTSGNDLLSLSSEVSAAELESISKGILEKSGLSAMHLKLQYFRKQ